MVITQMAFDSELVNWRGVVHSNFLLFGIVSDSHPNVISATFAPNIIWHFKSNNDDSQMDFFGSLPEGVGTLPFVETSFGGVIVRRVPLIHSFTFSHFYLS